MKIKTRSAAALAAMALLCGCATGRSVVTLNDTTPMAAPTVDAQQPAVKIVDIEDQRVFLLSPPEADTPSLKDGAITDKSITTRAVGRKRGGFGQALGDILLPEGDSVANHMRLAITDGFRRAGYSVVTPIDPNYRQAKPVSVKVLQYWTWLQPRFSHLRVRCRSEVQFDTTLPALTKTPKVTSETDSRAMQLVLESDYTETATQCFRDTATKLAELLKANDKNE